MDAIIVDTEYTTWPGAIENGWAEPWQHREIVQVSAIRVDADFREIEHFDQIVRPVANPVLSDLFVELTGITQERVDEEGIDAMYAIMLFQAFTEEGRLPIICMNADEAVFRENCSLFQYPFPFPRSWHRLRPFIEANGVDLTGLSSGDLHKLTPNPIQGHVHNALHDVRSMGVWLRHAMTSGLMHDISQLPTGAPATDPRSRRTS